MLGLVGAVAEGVEFDEDEQAVVVSVQPRKAAARRCGRCGKRCPGYDRGLVTPWSKSAVRDLLSRHRRR